MESLLLVFVVLNLLFSVGLLVIVLLRGRGGVRGVADVTQAVNAGAEMRQELQGQVSLVRQDLQAQRTELGQVLRASSDAQSVELVRERDARALANKDLNEVLGKSITELRQAVEQRFDVLHGRRGQA